MFFILKKKATLAIYFNCDGEGADTYRLMFRTMTVSYTHLDVYKRQILCTPNILQ